MFCHKSQTFQYVFPESIFIEDSLIRRSGDDAGSAAYNKMVADMQRLDQVLRELQPVLKTLNEKSNALVFEAKDKKDPEPKRAKQ